MISTKLRMQDPGETFLTEGTKKMRDSQITSIKKDSTQQNMKSNLKTDSNGV